MAYTYKQQHVASTKYSIKCPYSMIAQYITIHNTANKASAKNEASYHNSNNNQVSYHIAIDDIEAIEVVPLNRNAWHCGDGNGNGNRKSIGIEICYSTLGGELYDKAEENAVQLTAKMLHERGWGIDKVKKHQDWSGKYCPHRILDKKNGWQDFLNRVQSTLNKLKNPTTQKPVTPTPVKKEDEIMLTETGRKEARELIKRAVKEGVFNATHTDAKIDKYSDGELFSLVIVYVNRKLK